MQEHAGSAAAETIIVGSPPDRHTGLLVPFNANFTLGSSFEYQQVYRAGLFTTPVMITEITFFGYYGGNDGEAGILPGNWSFSLSTTAKAVGQLSGDLGSNITGPQSPFYSGGLPSSILVTEGVPAPLNIAGTAFFYDPAGGNLLVDIIATGMPPNTVLMGGMSVGNLDLGNPNNSLSDMSKATNDWNGDPIVNSTALVTQFTFTTVPEPTAIGLLALAASGLMAQRRRLPSK